MARFNRIYSLVVGPGGGSGVEVSGLRIVFDITKDTTKHPNKSKVEIWNAAPDTRAMMEKPGTRCVLKVGYSEEDGPIECFQGDITFAWSRFEPANVVTVLELGDGAKATRDSVVSLGYAKGVGTLKALQDIADRMGLTLSIADNAPVREWNHGLSFHGAARTALDRVTRGTGLSWSVQGGVLQVIPTNGFTSRSVVDLALDSGLIGHPERQRKGDQEAITVKDIQTQRPAKAASATQAWDGWRVRSLILPWIVPGDRVKLSSRSVDAVFTVKDLKHHGDSHGSDWMTELRLVDSATAARLSAAEAEKAKKKAASEVKAAARHPAAVAATTPQAPVPSLPVPPIP